MQVSQQVVNLLVREHVSKAIHLVPAHANDVLGAVVIGRHPADGKIFPLEKAF